MIDTHTHLYLPEFAEDIEQVVDAAQTAGVSQCWLPGITASSLDEMERLARQFPTYFCLFAGLHPTEVKSDYLEELSRIRHRIQGNTLYKGIGEIGLDLYWDTTYRMEQQEALRIQLDWALADSRPVLLHVRQAFDEMMDLIRPYYGSGLKGVFHSFQGSYEQALELTSHGFLLGINGSITYKNSKQAAFLHRLSPEFLVLETDSPYLSPVPLRGKRNESANVMRVLQFVADLYGMAPKDLESITVANANCLLK